MQQCINFIDFLWLPFIPAINDLHVLMIGAVLGLFVVLNFVLLILRISFFKSTLRSLCASHPFKASHAKFQMFQGRKTQHIKNDGVHKLTLYCDIVCIIYTYHINI